MSLTTMSDSNGVTVTTEACSYGSVHASFTGHRDFPATRAEGPSTMSPALPSITEEPTPRGWPESMKVVASTTTTFGAIGHAVILEGRLPDFYQHHWPDAALAFGLRGSAR